MNHGANVYCNKGNVSLSAVCLNDLLMGFFFIILEIYGGFGIRGINQAVVTQV